MKQKIAMLLLLVCVTTMVNAQQGFDTSVPTASAAVDMTATNQGVQFTRMALTATAFTAPVLCGENMTITHTVGTVAPETKTVTYETVSTAIGGTGTKCWITQNLGADHQATSATDTTEASAGWYWQFNRTQGFKHDDTTRTPAAWDISNDNTSTAWEADKDPCAQLLGPGWRIPTSVEWTAANNTNMWNNYNDTYSSVLKIHAAGCLYNTDGSLKFRGNYGNYWSNTQDNATYGCSLIMSSSFAFMSNIYKDYGFSVRCLRD